MLELRQVLHFITGQELSVDPPLKPRGTDCPLPLAPIQLSMLANGGSLSVRMCAASLRLVGDLDVERLTRSLSLVVQRHESLRTRIVTHDGCARQLIENSDFNLEVIPFQGAAPMEDATRSAQEFVTKTINRFTDPLFEARLFRLSDCDHVLVMVHDHIVSDAFSCGILNAELWAFYMNAAQGMTHALPAPPLQFGDYVAWHSQFYESHRTENYNLWKRRLSGAPRVRIPSDTRSTLEPANTARSVGATSCVSFEIQLTERLRALARKENTFLSLVVLAVYAQVMSRWSGQVDVVIGFVSNGRNRPELMKLIGCLGTVLYLRVRVKEKGSFLALVRQIHEDFISIHRCQDMGEVMTWYPPEQTTDLLFNWVSTPRWQTPIGSRREAVDNIHVLPFSIDCLNMPRRRFGALFIESSEGVQMIVNYWPRVFLMETVEKFCRSMKMVASEVAREPLAPMETIMKRVEACDVACDSALRTTPVG